MITKIFAIKDCKQGFLNVTTEKNKLIVLRNLEQVVRSADENSLMAKFPADFSLYELGEFDTDTGIITPKVSFIEELSNLKS